jgi:hypothetical protein
VLRSSHMRLLSPTDVGFFPPRYALVRQAVARTAWRTHPTRRPGVHYTRSPQWTSSARQRTGSTCKQCAANAHVHKQFKKPSPHVKKTVDACSARKRTHPWPNTRERGHGGKHTYAPGGLTENMGHGVQVSSPARLYVLAGHSLGAS